MAVAASSLQYQSPTFHNEIGKPKVTMAPKIKGIDPEEYAKNLKEAKLIEANEKQDHVDKNTKRMGALKELKEKITEFDIITRSFSKSFGVGGTDNNVFNRFKVTGIMGGDEKVGGYVDFEPHKGASPSQYAFKIDQVASKDIRQTTLFSSSSEALGVEGDVVINGKNFPITQTTNLDTLLSQIKSSQDYGDLNVNVYMLNPQANQCYISFEGQELAKPIDFSGTPQSIRDALGLSNDSNKEDLQAKVTYQNQTFVRDTNVIKDILPNGTLTLKQESPNTIFLSTDYDKEYFVETLSEWTNSFNELQHMIQEHSAFDKEKGETEKDAILYNHPTLREIEKTLYTHLTRRVRIDVDKDKISGLAQISSITNSPGINQNMVINGTSIAINPSHTWEDIAANINAQTATTSVTMSYKQVGSAFVPHFESSQKGEPISFEGTPSEAMEAFGLHSSLSDPTALEGRRASLDINTSLSKIGIKIGIDTKESGKYNLSLDQEAFLKVYQNDFDLIRKTFQVQAVSSNSRFQVTRIPDVLSDDIAQAPLGVRVQKDALGSITATYTSKDLVVPAYISPSSSNDITPLIIGAKTWIKASDESKAVSDIHASLGISGNLKMLNTSAPSVDDKDPNTVPLSVQINTDDSLKSIVDKINGHLSASYSKHIRAEIYTNASGNFALQLISDRDIYFHHTTPGLGQALGFQDNWKAEETGSFFKDIITDFKFSLNDSESADTLINLSQGIAHRLEKKVYGYFLDPDKGRFQREDSIILKENKQLIQDIERIKESADKESERFKTSFQKVYAAVMEYEGMSKMLSDYKDVMYGKKG
jgi:flagellar capping protein FliD